MTDVNVVIGAGSNGQAIARRVSAGNITGSYFLIDGGVTAAYWYGPLAPT